MYGGGGYEGASQFAGGGFMASQGGADNGVSPTQGGKGRGGSRSESLIPLTVRQLHEALAGATLEDSFKVDGEEVNNLTIVGKIVNMQDSSTSLNYTIDDSTGTVDVRYWLDDDSDAARQSTLDWKVGTYVRVYGHLRSFQGQRSVVAFNLRPITDFNEITYHFLEAIYVHCHNTNTKAAPAPAPAGAPAAAYAPPANSAYQNTSTASGTGGDMATGANGMDPCQTQVMNVYNSPAAMQTDQGLSVDEVVNELGAKFSSDQIRRAVDFLVNEGHLYSTIDDNHYKSTSC